MTPTQFIVTGIVLAVCVLIAYVKGHHDGVKDEREEAELRKPRKARRLLVVNTKIAIGPVTVESSDGIRYPKEPNEWFQPKNLIGKKEALEV